MRRFTRFVTAAALTSFLCAPGSPSHAQTATREALNGDFEVGAKDRPDGWFPTYTDWIKGTEETVIFGWDADAAHSGSRSASIEISRDAPGSSIAYNWTRTVTGLEPGKIYRLRFWARVRDRGTVGFLFLEAYAANALEAPADGRGTPSYPQPLLQYGEPIKAKKTGEWELHRLDVQMPQRASELQLRLGMQQSANRGKKIWFDDVEVVESPRGK